MKKLLGLFLVVVMVFAMYTVYAVSDVSVEFDFEGFAGKEATQDSTTLEWMDYTAKSETPWTSANFVNNDTWLEPATRTDSVSGTAMRMVTKYGTTAYSSSNQFAFMIRPKGHSVSEAYPETWFSFDWMVEDLNADHEMRAYMLKTGSGNAQIRLFGIAATNGVLSTAAGATDITIVPGEWHTYEMCMSLTDGLLFYMDGQFLNKLPTVYLSEATWMFMHILKNDGSGKIKGTAMQFDNFKATSYISAHDKRLYGIKNDSFTEGADNSSITFTCTPYNITDTDKPYLMLLSIYDNQGRCVSYKPVSGTQPVFAPEMPVSVTVNSWGEGYTAKLHILTTWTNRTGFINKVITYTDVAE